MSDKLKQRNKLFILSFLFGLASCALINDVPNLNTEIICADGGATLVKFVRAKDLKRAILIAYQEKKKFKTSDKYTAIRLSDGRSFVLKNLPPEVAAGCNLRESKIGVAEPSYIHHF